MGNLCCCFSKKINGIDYQQLLDDNETDATEEFKIVNEYNFESPTCLAALNESKMMEVIHRKITNGYTEINIALHSSLPNIPNDDKSVLLESIYRKLKPVERAGYHITISYSPIKTGEEYHNIYVGNQKNYFYKKYLFYIKLKSHMPYDDTINHYHHSSDIVYSSVTPNYYREKICVICYENLSNVLYKSCGHLQICYPCHTNKKDPVYKHEFKGRSICPICFTKVGKRGIDWLPLTREELLKYPIRNT